MAVSDVGMELGVASKFGRATSAGEAFCSFFGYTSFLLLLFCQAGLLGLLLLS